MKISKSLASCLVISYISIATTGCSQSSSQITRGPLVTGIGALESDRVKSPPPVVEPVKAPEVYDVICFQAVGFAVDRTMCSPDGTYKVPRNTEVTVYLKKETSVQQGTNTIVAFKYNDKNNGQLQKITVPEMESLASQGANIYTMYYHMAVNGLFEKTQDSAEVEIFNSKLGKFKMFDKSSTQVVFATGDTKIRYKHKPDALEKFSQRTGLH
jgi:hypothetical protein